MVTLARYIIRASFSQQCMAYVPEGSKVVYEFKNGRQDKVFDALEWLVAMFWNQVYHERSAEQMLLSNLPPQFWPLVDGPAYRIVALRAGWI